MLILMLTSCLAVLTVSPEKKEKLIDVIKIESLTIGDCECITGWLTDTSSGHVLSLHPRTACEHD